MSRKSASTGRATRSPSKHRSQRHGRDRGVRQNRLRIRVPLHPIRRHRPIRKGRPTRKASRSANPTSRHPRPRNFRHSPAKAASPGRQCRCSNWSSAGLCRSFRRGLLRIHELSASYTASFVTAILWTIFGIQFNHCEACVAIIDRATLRYADPRNRCRPIDRRFWKPWVKNR